MIAVEVNKEAFKFKYLQDYSSFLVDRNLEEFVTVSIRYSRDAELPLLKPLAKYSEAELIQVSLESNRRTLNALTHDRIAEHIQMNAEKWLSNTLGIIDKKDVLAEDLTLLFHVKRKIFSYFLDSYTKNVYLHRSIIEEVDHYTTQEELIYYNIFLKMQQEELARINADLEFHKELYLEAQGLGEIGSFLVNFEDESKSVYTPEYQRIFEFQDRTTIGNFMNWVHLDDQPRLQEVIQTSYKTGGKFEVEYRYKKSVKEKRIWSKGYIVSENGKPVLIRGIIKEVH